MKHSEDVTVRLRYGVFPIGLIFLIWLFAGLLTFFSIYDGVLSVAFTCISVALCVVSLSLFLFRPYAIATKQSVRLVSLASDGIFREMTIEEFKSHAKSCKWFIRDSDMTRYENLSRSEAN
ncbi:MAG: hypothetical protein ACI9FG_001367 [Crocinitomicaceae bacterium]|jgi:hypothetical protein